MALIELKRDPTARETRQFAVAWLPGFSLAVSLLAVWRGAPWSVVTAGVIVGALSIAGGAWRPRWMRGVLIAWMWAAFPIGWCVSHLLMAVIYFLVITPIGWILRLAGRDPLARRFDRDLETYWTPRVDVPDPSRYFRQF